MSHCVYRELNSVFISNDIDMKGDSRVSLMTGPNMGGKSTLLRCVATSLIMA